VIPAVVPGLSFGDIFRDTCSCAWAVFGDIVHCMCKAFFSCIQAFVSCIRSVRSVDKSQPCRRYKFGPVTAVIETDASSLFCIIGVFILGVSLV
jgi:hypothetical protein